MNLIKELWKTGNVINFTDRMKVEINGITIYFNRIMKTKTIAFLYDIRNKNEYINPIANMSNEKFEPVIETIDDSKIDNNTHHL